MRIILLFILFVVILGCHRDPGPDFADNPVVAHRGAWKNTGAPQNSFEAFEIALLQGYGGVEFDVHMTSDSVLVANHDPVYFGVPVQETPYEELNKMKLPNGEDLPLLERFLRRGMEQTETRLFLEVKPSERGRSWANATVAKVVDMVNALAMNQWVIYISFDIEMLKEIQRLDPSASMMYLTGTRSPEVLHHDGLTGPAYHFSNFRSREEWLREFQRLDMPIYTWTVNDPLEMVWFLNQQVEFIATDEPEILMDLYHNQR